MRSDPYPEAARTPASLPDGNDSPKFTPLLVGSPEAAGLLALSPRKLWTLTRCDAVPAHRIGRSVRYAPAELAAWIAAGCPEAPGSARRVRAAMRKGAGR